MAEAPLAGKVLELSVVPGEFRNDTSAGLMTIADLSTVWVTSQVPETYIRFVQVGERVDSGARDIGESPQGLDAIGQGPRGPARPGGAGGRDLGAGVALFARPERFAGRGFCRGQAGHGRAFMAGPAEFSSICVEGSAHSADGGDLGV